jgi:hypothetical protein
MILGILFFIALIVAGIWAANKLGLTLCSEKG